jgi:hypothetical protein
MNTQTLTDRLFRPSSSSLLNMLRSFEGVGRPLSRVEPAVQRERYLSTKRLDPLLEVPTEEPICMRGTPRVNHIPDEDEAFEMPFTAEELMESFMEQNSTTTAELMALAPVDSALPALLPPDAIELFALLPPFWRAFPAL